MAAASPKISCAACARAAAFGRWRISRRTAWSSASPWSATTAAPASFRPRRRRRAASRCSTRSIFWRASICSGSTRAPASIWWWKRCAAPIATARCTWAIRISCRCRSPCSRMNIMRRVSARASGPTRRCRAICCRESKQPRWDCRPRTSRSSMPTAIAWRGRYPSICFSAPATWCRTPACCSTTPWTTSPSNPDRRTRSAWWATHRTTSHRTSVPCRA